MNHETSLNLTNVSEAWRKVGNWNVDSFGRGHQINWDRKAEFTDDFPNYLRTFPRKFMQVETESDDTAL